MSENVGDVTLGISSLAGIVVAINEYATVISISLTALGILAGILFHVLAFRDRRIQMDLQLKILKSKKCLDEHNKEKE